MVDKPKILSPYEIYSVHTPEVSPHTIERVICCFWLVLDLVLVFVGFGLSQICSPFSFSPHSKDHALQRGALLGLHLDNRCSSGGNSGSTSLNRW